MGISEAKRIVEGLLQPGFNAAAMGTSLGRIGAFTDWGVDPQHIAEGNRLIPLALSQPS